MAAVNNPVPPMQPADTELDKQRVSLLLEINQILVFLVAKLQAEGKGGDVQSPAQNDPSADPSQKKPSREYVEPLRRMQANLAYLANLAERNTKPNQQQHPWPQVMTAPPGASEELAGLYTRLQGMFPQWRVQQQRMAAAQAAQAQQAAQQNTAPSMGQMQDNSMG